MTIENLREQVKTISEKSGKLIKHLEKGISPEEKDVKELFEIAKNLNDELGKELNTIEFREIGTEDLVKIEAELLEVSENLRKLLEEAGRR